MKVPERGQPPRNLWYMKRYYERYFKANIKLQPSVVLLQWGHNRLLLDKESPLEKVLFYSQEVIQKGWTKELLLNALKMNTYTIHQQQLKSNNFDIALPEAQADYANAVFRSYYNLGFLGITEPVKEVELEKRLVSKIKSFLLELGKGFSFIGNQYRLEYNNKE